jgi:hypothetical protein
MTVSTFNSQNIDLSLLAIQAANELERIKRNMKSDLQSVRLLSEFLNDFFSNKDTDRDKVNELNYRLDHALVLSNAYSHPTPTKKSIDDIISEAYRLTNLLMKDKHSKHELDNLISFCVALADSASLYNEELEDLKKHFA